MTPVQAGAIPLFMKNKDVVVEAVTGSGKTLAFVIPIIEKLVRLKKRFAKNEIGALVITPTRELAQQISSVFSIFLKDSVIPLLKHALITGGTSTLQDDICYIKEFGPDILIGTPGRLEDLLVGRGTAKNYINTKELEILVLDEADRLFDMGFSQSLNNIIAHLPKQRRTGLFSATMTDGLAEIVRAGLRNPVRVMVKVEDLVSKDVQRIPATLQIGYILCEPHQKLSQVLRLLTYETTAKKYIIYFATCACVDYFFKIFSKMPQLKGISIYSLHGKMDTKRRTATYRAFLNLPSTSSALLLCTDVAARGLDVPDVDFVIQMDPPQDPKVFAHRCGRTARAGKEGKAIVLLGHGREEVYVDFLKIRKIPLKQLAYILPGNKANSLSINDDDIITQAPVSDDNNEALLEQIRKIVLMDRDLHDKGTKAFVSYIRSYSKHEANYIFRLKDLDLGKVAKGYCLLKLPKMPELKDIKIEFEDASVNMDGYKYANKAREQKRLSKLESDNAKLNIQQTSRQKKVFKGPWSEKLAAKQRRTERRIKRSKKREYLKKRKAEEINGSSDDINKSKDIGVCFEDEWEELQKEERLAKKLKKGIINQEEFDRVMGLTNNDEAEV
ncbi:P-loop containing nucleoside triphosphate hydrolase protein [Gigaspora rosea]|uniref:ATP-dependent RNA helicase n=1 Tax=Gigaspora rosea TaxID=44941 RepID=A0A397UA48_9GLOM|nr:P-loop containing nucleoside triphosphate hydrolase protein [Gigaspora rosea]